MLEHIELDKVMLKHTNTYYGHKEGLRRVKKYLMKTDQIARDADFVESDDSSSDVAGDLTPISEL